MSQSHTVEAEYDRLSAVRVHEPGFEAALGALDPGPNHFSRPFSAREARREHERIVSVLRSAGVEVCYLHDELADGGALEPLLESAVAVADGADGADAPDRADLLADVRAAGPHAALEALLLGPTFGRTTDADPDGPGSATPAPDGTGGLATSLDVRRPITNLYFQRDCQVVGDRGPIVPRPYSPTRRRELPLIEAAWEARGAAVAGRVDAPETFEGGDFMPLGEFALLSTSAVVDGEEAVLRSTRGAAAGLLEAGAVGYDEVGVVRPPLAADERLAAAHDTGSRLLHLDGWFNVAAEGLAVAREPLLEAATVERYVREADGYARRGTESLAALLDRHDYEVIDAPYPERWATNFLTVDDGVVLPIYETDDGAYDPADNRTIERLKREGVEVLPDGEGVDPANLTNGGGGIHCMTSPIARG